MTDGRFPSSKLGPSGCSKDLKLKASELGATQSGVSVRCEKRDVKDELNKKKRLMKGKAKNGWMWRNEKRVDKENSENEQRNVHKGTPRNCRAERN